jgi:beta-galactosidase/beta-glucuronidase
MSDGKTSSIPRSEYPRPQFVRKEWLCLNGTWEFEIDAGDSGLERGLLQRPLQQAITVPFCPESTLSGIGNTDFLRVVWYRRRVVLPEAWADKRVLLHFQAVDYDTTVWVNGVQAGRHRGGFSPFSFDISEIAGVSAGSEIEIVVRARDDIRQSRPQACGKQSRLYQNHSCLYTRTTGIWQTVWLEPVPDSALCRPRITPDVERSCFVLEQAVMRKRRGQTIRARLLDLHGLVSESQVSVQHGFAPILELPIEESNRRLWQPEDPYLYQLSIELLDADGVVLDQVESYAGMRSVTVKGKEILINGRRVFQRLVLDQGYYPDGIMTAPSEEALVRDIELSMAAGFNGARLHQKVFEERFLYHADRLGYMVWGEFADWGCNQGGPWGYNQQPDASYITQWLEVLERDYSHPSIIGWCPLNETTEGLHDNITVLEDITKGLFLATKGFDRTRPVLDTSGYSHRVAESDLYDVHDYEQNPEQFRKNYEELSTGKPRINTSHGVPISIPYHPQQPFFVSEFGGIWWNASWKEGEDSWGYGQRPATEEEFYQRLQGLCDALFDHPDMFGFCYTQLTDVYQEQNGIYDFHRNVKFDMERIRKIMTRKAAYE